MAAHGNEQLSAYLDGELTDAEAAELEQQLRNDPRLRAELEDLRHVQDLLRTHGPRQAPPDFFDKVMAITEPEPLPNRVVWSWLRRPLGIPVETLAVAAAALLVVLFGVQYGAPLVSAPAVDKKLDAAVPEDEAPAAMAPVASAPRPTAEGTSTATKDEMAQRLDVAQEPQLSLPEGKGGAATAPPEAPAEAKNTYEAQAPAKAGETLPVIAGEAANTVAAEPSGTADASGTTTYRFVLTRRDVETLQALQRLATRYDGYLVNEVGTVIVAPDAASLSSTVYLKVPAKHFAALHEALRKLPVMMVSGPGEDTMFKGDVWVRFDMPEAGGEPNAAPSKMKK